MFYFFKEFLCVGAGLMIRLLRLKVMLKFNYVYIAVTTKIIKFCASPFQQ